jgi:large subunit ribosomal protein L4
MTSSPLWRGGGKIFPNSPDENFSRRSTARCTAPVWPRSCRSWLARTSGGGRELQRRSAEDPPASQKLKGMGLDSVLVITDK